MLAGAYWDSEQSERIVKFVETYVSPKVGKGRIRLLKWQTRLLQSLHGWRKADTNRRFRRAIIHCSRKNGKTLLTGALALAELFLSEEPSPLVVSLSTSRNNASQVYGEICESIRRHPKLAAMEKRKEIQFTDHTKRIRIPGKGSEYFAAAADSKTGRGFPASLIIADEAGWHHSRGPWDSWQFGAIGRVNGMSVIISTAGDPSGWYYGEYCRAKRILSGEELDQSTYCEIYECPQDGPDGYLEDPANWKAASPSLDEYDGYTSDNFRSDLLAAKGDAGSWLNFRRDRLNLWLKASADNWIDPNRWMSGKMPEPADLNRLPCYVGVDLSQRTDPSSVSACWVMPDNRFYFKSWAWVARKGVELREKQNMRRYDEFTEVVITDGDMIDQSKVKSHILWLCSTYDVKEITADAYNAIILMEEVATETGRTVSKFPQNFKHYTDPCKQFERAINEGRAKHDGNGWLSWCVANLRLDADKWGNVMPSRGKSVDKIDGAVAALMAFGLANLSPMTAPKQCVYNSSPVWTISR